MQRKRFRLALLLASGVAFMCALALIVTSGTSGPQRPTTEANVQGAGPNPVDRPRKAASALPIPNFDMSNPLAQSGEEAAMLTHAASHAADAELSRFMARQRNLTRLPVVKDSANIVFPNDPNVDVIRAFPLDDEAGVWLAQLHLVDLQGLAMDKNAASIDGIFMLDGGTGSRRLLVENTRNVSYRLDSVSPDKRRALVWRQDRDSGKSCLCVVDVDTKKEVRLEGTEKANGRCSWDQAGNLYFSTLVAGKSSAIYRTSASGGEPQLVLEESCGPDQRSICDPAPSSDGKYVYFTATSRKIGEDGRPAERWTRTICRVDTHTNAKEEVCEGQEPVLLPASGELISSRWQKGSVQEIFLHDLKSGSSTQLTQGEGYSAFAQNGKLYFISTRNFGHTNLFELGIGSAARKR